MNKIVLIPDSFKGTLSSKQICAITAQEIKALFPACDVVSTPVADGGEGSVDCFLEALGGTQISCTVKGPYLKEMPSFYGLIEEHAGNATRKTAIIEMASCAGLPLVDGNKNPELTSTYGVGELILDAARRGATKVIVGLGGSCTNDAGCGAAAAAGVRFFSADGACFIPTGKTLKDVAHIDVSGLDPALEGVEIIGMCDIVNPMFGPNGAAFVFAPQKGADDAMVQRLEGGLRHLSEIMERDLHVCVQDVPGAGAAGAMGAGLMAFLDAELRPGIETVLDAVNFDEVIKDADYVITGEGKLDSQSLQGKVICGVAKRARRAQVPVIAIVGGADEGCEAAYDLGVTAIFSINRMPEDFLTSCHKSAQNLAFCVRNVMRLLASKGQAAS